MFLLYSSGQTNQTLAVKQAFLSIFGVHHRLSYVLEREESGGGYCVTVYNCAVIGLDAMLAGALRFMFPVTFVI